MGIRFIAARWATADACRKAAPSTSALPRPSCAQGMPKEASVAVGMSGMLVMIVVMFMPARVPGHVLNLDLHVLTAGVTEVQCQGEMLTGLQRTGEPQHHQVVA